MASRLSLLALACVLLTLPACSSQKYVDTWYGHADNESIGETGEEHFHRVTRIEDSRRRALNSDLDYLFQTDRPSRLTRWHTR